jgi:hypothetical protein
MPARPRHVDGDADVKGDGVPRLGRLAPEISAGRNVRAPIRTCQGHIKPENGLCQLPAPNAQPKMGKVSKLPEKSLRVSR